MPKLDRPVGEGKRVDKRKTTSTRIKPEVRAFLEEAATRSGRSLAQEMEMRLEQSFKEDRIAVLEAKIDLLLSHALLSEAEIKDRLLQPPSSEYRLTLDPGCSEPRPWQSESGI